jgi:hypothetical protein
MTTSTGLVEPDANRTNPTGRTSEQAQLAILTVWAEFVDTYPHVLSRLYVVTVTTSMVRLFPTKLHSYWSSKGNSCICGT